MKNVNTFKTLILAAACAAGLSAPAFAGDDPMPTAAAATTTASTPAAPSDSAGYGLLGQNYATLGYQYTRLTDANFNQNTYSFALNQGLRDGLDTLFEYNYTRSGNTGFGHLDLHWLDVGARAYANIAGFKPYAEAGIGLAREKIPGLDHRNSFVWFTGVGAEFQVAKDLSVTPLVRYSYANRFSGHGEWDYGVKGNYWLTEKIGLQASVLRDNTRDMSYGVGVNFRF